jgi:hypothetical protein
VLGVFVNIARDTPRECKSAFSPSSITTQDRKQNIIFSISRQHGGVMMTLDDAFYAENNAAHTHCPMMLFTAIFHVEKDKILRTVLRGRFMNELWVSIEIGRNRA